MQVQVETDNHIRNREELSRYVESVVSDAIDRFADHVTSVQVHLHDENSTEKAGARDQRCLMEARVAGLKQVAVSDHADNLHQAIQGAVDKLQKALDTALGKLQARQRHTPDIGHMPLGPDGDLAPPAR
jgi:ribosomal subunit interface protein